MENNDHLAHGLRWHTFKNAGTVESPSDRECLDLAIETETFGGLCPNGETVEQALRQLLGRSDVTAVAEAFKAWKDHQ